MSGINTGRVVVGGIVAGLVINVVESVVNLFILAESMDGMLAALNLEPIGGGAIGGFVVLAFLLGWAMLWTYAAIRPRFGEGPATALKAGFLVWLLFYCLPLGANWLMGMYGMGLLMISLAYTLPMMLGAAYVGAMVYKEEEA